MSLHTERGTLSRSRTKGPALYFSRVEGDEIKATCGIIPGYADYGERYEHVQRAWAERGITSVAIDLRGHGRAEGPRGSCRHWDEYLDDAEELFALLDKHAGKPTFLFGHSFGGVVAAVRAETRPEGQRALLLSNPFFKLALPASGAKLAAGRLASAFLPFVSVPAGIHGKDLTHDAARAKAYDEDPLIFKKANVRYFTENEGAQARAMRGAPSFELPLYVVLGTSDPVVSGGREFFDAAASKDKTLDVREGLLHEVLNEPEWPAIAGAMADWMLARCG
jgi:alpha-beta hydrolase superfamily lysophospholipase